MAEQLMLASFRRRAAALAVDTAVLGAVLGPIQYSLAGGRGHEVADFLVAGFLGLGTTIAYFGAFEGTSGATFGKRLFRIRVLDADSHERLGARAAFIRAVGRNASGLAFQFGYLRALADPGHRTWHDLWARSLVVVTSRGGRPGD